MDRRVLRRTYIISFLPSPGRKSETIDRIHGKTKQEEIPNESEYNHHQYVAHAQDGADSLISKKTPYVPPHSGEQNGKHDRKGEELHGTIEMLNIDKGYCAMEGNNKATYKTYSGVTKSGDKRTRSDVERIGEQDTDRSAAIVHGAMCIESPRSNEAKVIANEIETQRLPGQHTSHSACTWTSLTHQGQELNIGNREPSHEEVPTVDQPSGLDSDDKSPTQLKALEQSGDLSDIRTIVSNTGKSIQKPDLSRVNGWHITGITEPYHQSDWHFRDGECAKQSRLGASSSCTQQDLDVSPLTKERVTVNAWSTPAGNNAEPPPKSEESLSARIRKKSMLLAYDEGQLEIADDTTYRSLDIETDIDLITQINKVHEEFVHNMMTPLKSPENSSLKRTGSISKGSEFSSATSSVTKSQERKHSPPSGGNFKRNSPKSSSFRRPSGVSIASIDFDGKEQKPTTPLEKWQKLKKHISDSILGSTKHKQGRKTTSDSSLPQDYSSVRRASAADVATIPKVYRKDSGADLLCARGEDNDRTPKLERRPSLRRQRKLAMSPVENERLFNQLQKERTNSWSGSDDSGIHNNQSRSSTDVSITEDDQTKESNAVPGEQDVVVRRRRPHAQRRPKSDIGDHRWEDYGAMGGPPAPPPRTVTRRPISDPVMRDEDELVIYRDKRSSQPRPKSAHLGDYSSLSRDRPISPTPPPRCRPGSLAVIKDYGGEDNTGSATTTPTTENAPITIEATEESTKVPAGSKLRRARRPRPVSDLGHIDLKEIDDYVQRRRYSGVLSPEDMSVIQQPPQPFTPNSTESNISRSFSTPSALHQLIDPNIRPGNLHDEDSSSGEDISTSGYETIHTGLAPQDYYYEDYSGTMTYVEALWDHVTMDEDELPFQAGDVIEVTDKLDKDWWWGRINMKEGWFPASFVRPRVNQGETVEDCVAKIKDGTLSLTSKNMRKISISFLSKDQVRAKVINEITSTEKIYVKHLRDVCEGYLKQCCKRPEMFSSELVGKIFGNIEAIYEFQSKFMKKLESCVNQELPHLSEIGNCFLDNRAGFEIYAEYCNNHPTATAALQEVLENRKYRHFFEACRLLQEMIEISLDGFLLTPVQKICKYPLQLAELLKYTKPEDKDYEPVKEALQEMKNVASLINERKRRMESLHKIARWQLTIEAWEGEDVLERSSILIHSGEVTKISKGLGRAKVRQLFLFDHQIVLCKRDLLNRNRFSFTGRIYIDQIKLEDMDDGKDNAWGISVKNAFQLHNQTDEKWHIISVKSKEEKDKWVKAFADERKLVRDDRKKDFVIHSSKKVEAKFSALKEQSQQAAKKPKKFFNQLRISLSADVSRKISHMPFPHQLQPLVDKPQKSVTLPQGISSVDAFVGENYKKRTWNLFGTIRKKK
ncbi:uncharacterized protein LOC100376365 [Saccoglossus kowalevskii]|uniref:Uncharacterized protein LOC100376365 n=1 Tax=Saccoglossus kowalevskii TaxID=10224 RepID=A0ABM0M8X1_SACKO|nr:PREDICTED: uncharacterized protein LOC100376365 [Saccoglossus kowalevskii]